MIPGPTRNARVPSASPTLEGARVNLRAATAADATALREISFYDGVAATSEDEVRAHLQRITADQARGETVHWAIEDTRSARLAGTVGFYRGFPGGVGEIGYVLRPAYRGRGLMTEAVGLAVAYGFEVLGLRAVVAHTDAANRTSIAVLERCGFALVAVEGAQRTYERR
ncbi:MAG: GNAT family N-acetyltransferase [Trueperaceae bacterium]|nr:GNAT family N-acetyltransferase [Trueperaceae bacterium]